MMRRLLKYVGITLLLLVGLAVAGLFAMAEYRRASPDADALAALESDSQVTVAEDRWLVYRPVGTTPRTGVILYPGASCDVRGYAPVLRELAAQGYLVVNVHMPFDFSIFAPKRALEVRAAYPEIERWVLVGHSMGGAMAAQFVHDYPDVMQGLVMWDSYPPGTADLSGRDLPVWNIHRATPEGAAPESFEARRPLYPDDSRWVAIAGGNHMNFGSFIGGAYVEQWEATISRGDQQAQVLAATLDAVRTVAAP
jgi:pimeloyl-ACP methyl ester carboxylesterase